MKWNPYPQTKPEKNAGYIVWSNGWWVALWRDGAWRTVDGSTMLEKSMISHWMEPEDPHTRTRLKLVHAFGEIHGETYEELAKEFAKLPEEYRDGRYMIFPVL